MMVGVVGEVGNKADTAPVIAGAKVEANSIWPNWPTKAKFGKIESKCDR